MNWLELAIDVSEKHNITLDQAVDLIEKTVNIMWKNKEAFKEAIYEELKKIKEGNNA